MSDQILDVDLLAFERGDRTQRKAVVDGVMRSLQTGFVYSTHDVGEDLLDEAYGMLKDFFALTPEQKLSWRAPDVGNQTGYTGLGGETAVSSNVADWKEMLNWSSNLPSSHPLKQLFASQYPEQLLPDADVPGISKALNEMHTRLLDVQLRVLRIIAVGLGVGEHFFDDLCEGGATLSRAIRYPPMAEATDQQMVWAAEHADINLITALPRASAPGLEVLTSDGWIPAAPPDGRVILNTGIMLDRLTNGRIPGGWHRVVADPGQQGDRLSVVQFCHPAGWFVLDPLSTCVDAEHPQKYGAIRAGDLLAKVVWEIDSSGA